MNENLLNKFSVFLSKYIINSNAFVCLNIPRVPSIPLYVAKMVKMQKAPKTSK